MIFITNYTKNLLWQNCCLPCPFMRYHIKGWSKSTGTFPFPTHIQKRLNISVIKLGLQMNEDIPNHPATLAIMKSDPQYKQISLNISHCILNPLSKQVVKSGSLSKHINVEHPCVKHCRKTRRFCITCLGWGVTVIIHF